MLRLEIHPAVVGELRALRGGAYFAAFFQQLKADQSKLKTLLDPHEWQYGNSKYDVDQWRRLWRLQHDIWRIKFLDVPPHVFELRAIYAYEIPNTFHVLTVARRPEINYDDPTNAVALRALARFREICS